MALKPRKEHNTMTEEVLPIMTVAEARKSLGVSETRMKQLLDGRKLKTARTEGGSRVVLSASVHARNSSPSVRAQRQKLKNIPA